MQTNESAPKTTAAPVTTTSVAPQAYAQPDGRPSTVQAQSLVNAIDNSPRQVAQMKAVEAINESPRQVVQRMVDVSVDGDDEKKQIVAKGPVADFKGGTSAGPTGWVGVTSYRSRYEVSDDTTSKEGKSRTLKNGYTTPEAGHVLGKQNGGNGGDPENVFAQDGGSNNSSYKAFEGRMRKAIKHYEDKGGGNVTFVSYLVGTDIEEGNIADEAESSASDISSNEEDSSGSSMSESEDSSSSSMSVSEDSSDSD